MALVTIDAQNQQTSSSDEADLLALHNQERTRRGIAPVRMSSSLSSLALSRSREMAEAHAIWHDYGIGRRIDGRHYVGENVGRGPTAADVFYAFMSSDGHRFNVLRGAYDSVGIASVRSDDGDVYVTVIYLSPELGGSSRARSRGGAPPSPAHVARAHAITGASREVSMLVQLIAMESR